LLEALFPAATFFSRKRWGEGINVGVWGITF